MRIVSNLDPDTYDEIQELVKKGDYRDVDQFIQVAVDNQLRIEKDEEIPGTPEISDGGTQRTLPKNQNTDEQTADLWGYVIPENIPLADPYDSARENVLLFSQYYRFFPLKFVLVELAKETAAKGGAVELSEFRETVKEKVEPLRDAIVDWEETNDIKKQNRKSTGLPKTDVKNPDYSMKRFLDQYVGSIRKSDLSPSSFGEDLALIAFNPINEDRCLLQLSPAGRDFAGYTNPLLSKGPKHPPISEEEAVFLVSQISSTLPAEYEFMSLVYKVLEETEGDTYTQHLGECREYLEDAPGFDDDPSDNRVRSQTAGALSRMVELGLVDRGKRRGVYLPNTPPEEYAGL